MNNQLPLFIFDNFYQNPADIRNFAVKCNYKKPLISSTPSLVSDIRHPNTKSVLLRIGKLINVVPDWEKIENVYSFWGQSACGEFQLTLEHLNDMGQVHSHKNGEWVGIVYLSDQKDCEGRVGTFLLKHKELDIFHSKDVTSEQYEILKKDARDKTKWEILASPEMQYNRLIIFDSRIFHATSSGFGNTPSSGRLIQIFNFTTKPVSHLRQ